jgi:hypothetical protein
MGRSKERRVAFPGRKKRPARVLFAAILLIVFYFLLFPYPLGRELVVRPRWAVALPQPGSAPIPSPSTAAGAPDKAGMGPAAAEFQIGDRFGFVRGDGTLLYAGQAVYRVALSSSGFVSFTRLGTDWILQDPAGRRVAGFSVAGYPLLSPDGGRVFSVKTDLSGLIEMDRSGGILWDRDFPGLMTAISVQADLVLVGLMNGTLVLLDRHGSSLLEHPLAGSRIPVVVGDAAAPDGSRIAAVCGIDPQYLAVLRRSGSGYEPETQQSLPSSFRREVRMGFSPDSRYLFLEGTDGPGLFDPARRALRWVTLPGPLAAAAFASEGRVAAFASRDAAGVRLVLEPLAGIPVGRETFPAREIFLGTIEGQLLLGWDGRVARIDMEAM